MPETIMYALFFNDKKISEGKPSELAVLLDADARGLVDEVYWEFSGEKFTVFLQDDHQIRQIISAADAQGPG